MNDLEALRAEIRAVDDQMLALVRRRDDAARRIGTLKHLDQLPLQNFEVEKAVLDHALAEGARLGIHDDTTRSLVQILIQSALRVQERDPARGHAKTGRTALVIGGAGLMGDWFCRFLDERGHDVFVDDPRPSSYPSGRLADRTYDVVILATPPSTIPGLLRKVGGKLPPKTLLFDIGSVKGESVPVLQQLAKEGKRVASLHPMFGPKTDLLMGRNVLVLDAGHEEAARAAAELFAGTAARVLPLPLDRHDAVMADVLTLSHALNLAFNHALAASGRTHADLEPYGSTTFRRQVDVSREVAGENPRLYFEIEALNPGSGGVLGRLEASVRALREAVAHRDEKSFIAFMERGRAFFGGSA